MLTKTRPPAQAKLPEEQNNMKNLRRRIQLAVLLIISWLILLPAAFAVDPPPDGGYPKENTAEGEDALFNLTSGSLNTAIGFNALYGNTSGAVNTAVGHHALFSNISGLANTATGANALSSNIGGRDNSAFGQSALLRNEQGDFNTGIGWLALQENTDGDLNVAIGALAMWDSEASGNVAVGYAALQSVHDMINTAVGYQALRNMDTGRRNIALGQFAGIKFFNGSDNIYIANPGLAEESGAVRIGTEGIQTATYVAGIRTSPLATAIAVGIGADGRLGVRASSASYKEGIQPMGRASEAILSLEPVTFHYKKDLDPSAAPQFGLVAEEVDNVAPELVAHDDKGRPFTVRYDEVNAMLLNEFIKEHRKVEALAATVARLQATLEKQATQIEKVNARLAAEGPAGRLVENR